MIDDNRIINLASNSTYYFKLPSLNDTNEYKFFSLTPSYAIRTVSILMARAETVWREDETEVRFIKDRRGLGLRKIETEEEYKEFTWVKLCSIDIGMPEPW